MIQSQIVTLKAKGQLSLPQPIRTAAGLHSGSTLTVTLEPDGTITVRPVRGKLEAFFHSLDGVASAGSSDVDAAILAAIQTLDFPAGQD
jgi:AbrB family looped-hinge helix DNA binding protein